MNTSTLCQVCQSGTAEHQCGRCASLVCDRHFDSGAGLCTTCAAESGHSDTPR